MSQRGRFSHVAVLSAVLCCLDSSTAEARQLVWRSEVGQVTTYAVHSQIALWMPQELLADVNDSITVRAYDLELRAVCLTSARDTRGWLLSCMLEDVALAVTPDGEPSAHYDEVLDELRGKLEAASVDLTLSDRGTRTAFDVHGIPNQDARQAKVLATLSLLLDRTFAGFDLVLPDSDDRAWSQPNPALLAYPTTLPVLSRGKLKHRVDLDTGRRLSVESIGKGGIAITAGAAVVTLQATIEGNAILDTQDGGLVERTWTVRGKSPVGGDDYQHTGRVVRVDTTLENELAMASAVRTGTVPLPRAVLEPREPMHLETHMRVSPQFRFHFGQPIGYGGQVDMFLHSRSGVAAGLGVGYELTRWESEWEVKHPVSLPDVHVGASYQLDGRVTPRLAVQAGIGQRFVGEATPSSATVPSVGADLGVDLPGLLGSWSAGATVGLRRDTRVSSIQEGATGVLRQVDPRAVVAGVSLTKGLE